jgi:DNA-binding MarR family transcriptional regulator
MPGELWRDIPDRRLQRFIARYLDCPLKIEIIRVLARFPNQDYTVEELARLAGEKPAEVERELLHLWQSGLVLEHARGGTRVVRLSSTPVAREMSFRLWKYCLRPHQRERLLRLVGARHN